MDDRREPRYTSRYSSRERNSSNEGPSNKYRRKRTNLSEKTIPKPNPNPNLDIDLVKRIEFLINQNPRDLLRKLDELRDQLSHSCEISEKQIPVPLTRRALSSTSFRRQNPRNEIPDFQNPGFHFQTSSSYNNLNHSREHERYRRVRLMPHENNYNYTQYNSIPRDNYSYRNNQYREFQPRVEENYGFAPVDNRSLVGSRNGSVYSNDWVSRRSDSSKRRAKRSFLPLNGASPFAVCNNCFSLLQIPSGFVFNKGKKMVNIKCGNCFEVISLNPEVKKIGSLESNFSMGSSQNWNYRNYDGLREKNRVYSKDVNPVVSLSAEMEEREYDYDNKSSDLEASGSFVHERDVLEHLFNTQEKRKALLSEKMMNNKNNNELERSSEDIKEAVEIVNNNNNNEIISDKNIHEEMEAFHAKSVSTNLGNKEEMERSSFDSEINSADVALNDEINTLLGENMKNKEDNRVLNDEIYALLEESAENKEEMEASCISEENIETNEEKIENKNEMEASGVDADVASKPEIIVNGSVFEKNSEETERSFNDENIELEGSINKDENLEEIEGCINKGKNLEEIEGSINKDDNLEEIEGSINKDENLEEKERSFKNEKLEAIDRSIQDESSENSERSFKDENLQEIEGSFNKNEKLEEMERSFNKDEILEETERSIRVDSVNSNSTRGGSSRSSFEEEQVGGVISKNGDSSFFGGLIKKRFKFNNSEGSKCKVFVNGRPISERAVKRAEKKAGPIDPGNYWYDYQAGFWGVMGHECLGIIPPLIREFHYPMPRDCAGGRTGVIVNGRELHKKDLDVLVRRGLPVTSARAYIIEMSGKVVDVASGKELKNLGKLAPTIEILKRGFGMLVPQDLLS